jgi:hypothetical protein
VSDVHSHCRVDVKISVSSVAGSSAETAAANK